MKKLLLSLIILLASFYYVNAQGVTCSGASPFCTGTNYSFPASTNVPSLGTVGCLYTTPNPAYYWMQVDNPGNIDIHIASGGDVDFICWGPFATLADACATNLMANTGVDCSYSIAAQEDCNIVNAQTGQVYVLLITNYYNQPTNISFSQTGGAGTTNCGIIAPPITNNGPLCEGQTLQLSVTSPIPGAIYHWTGPAGFTSSLPSPTVSPVTIANAGVYTLTITIGSQTSPAVTTTVVVNPNPVVTPTATLSTICLGESTVLSATSTVSGANITWIPGPPYIGTPITLTPTTTTTYTVTGESLGCTGTNTVTVTVNPNPVVSSSAFPLSICVGESSTLTGISDLPGTIFDWTPGPLAGSSVTVSPLGTTVYTLIGTALGCKDTSYSTVTVKPNPVLTPTAYPVTICAGSSSTITIVSNLPGTSYTWQPSPPYYFGSPITVSPTITTNYTFTGTSMGCSNTGTVSVTVNPQPVIIATATPPAICIGQSTTLDVTSNVPGTTFTWEPGTLHGSSVNVSPTINTTYTVIGISTGCSGSTSVTVTVNPNPVITATATQNSICNGSSTTINGTSDLTGTSFTWLPGAPLSGPSQLVSPTTTTIYTATGTIYGCTGTDTVLVTVRPNPVVTAVASSNIICQGVQTTLTGGSDIGGTLYSWVPGPPLYGQYQTVSPSTTTIYTVTGTAAQCTGTDTIQITVNPNPVLSPLATPPTICTAITSSLSVSSSIIGTDIVWTNTGDTISPITVSPAATTVYTIIGTAPTGCTGSTTVTLTVNLNPVVTANANPAIICNGASSTLTGTSNLPNTTYDWNNGAHIGQTYAVSPTVTTIYTVVGTSSGCSASDTVMVTVNPNPVISITATPDTICVGASTTLAGSSTITGSTWHWLPNNQSTATITESPIITTTYTLTGTALNCSGSKQITVIVHPNPVLIAVATPPQVCFGSSSSLSVTSTVTGTSVIWNPGGPGTPITVTPTATTTYSVVGTAAGCTGSTTVTVNVNPIVTASTGFTNVTCNGLNNGSAWVNVLTGTAPYIYHWSNNASTDSAINLAPNQYNVTITDVHGCDTVYHFTITQPTAISLTLNPINENCVNSCDGSISTIVNGGTGNITYNWSNGLHTPGISTLCPGSYSVTVTDSNGCTKTNSASILTISLIQASFTADPIIGILPLPVTFNFTGSGASTYLWNFGDGSTSTEQNPVYIYNTDGTFTVLLTVNSGAPTNCIDTFSMVITVSPPPEIIAPNVFTPNGDGVNDKFIFTIKGIETLSCSIFDRWGKKINEFTDATTGWDGNTKSGKPSAAGVYYYVISASGVDKKPIEMNGTVTLIR